MYTLCNVEATPGEKTLSADFSEYYIYIHSAKSAYLDENNQNYLGEINQNYLGEIDLNYLGATRSMAELHSISISLLSTHTWGVGLEPDLKEPII